MPGRSSPKVTPQIVAKRREIVAELRLRQMTERAIAVVMGTPPPPGHDPRWYFPNPVTGRPWTTSTIHEDLTALSKQWVKHAEVDTFTRKAEQLAELREARKRAWERDDYEEVRKNLAMEIELTGTGAAQRHEVTGKNGGVINVVESVVFYIPDDERNPHLPETKGVPLPLGG